MKSELDSPELHAEKKVRIEEVRDNCQAIDAERPAESIMEKESIKNKQTIKKIESIKKIENIKKIESIKKNVEVQLRGSKPNMDSEEILELNSEGEHRGRKGRSGRTNGAEARA